MSKEKSEMQERRYAPRKNLEYISAVELTSLSHFNVFASEAKIVDVSSSGYLLQVSRQHFVQPELRDTLTLDAVVGHQIAMFLPQLNLDLDGTIIRAKHVGKGFFEVAVTFSPETPQFWRECLVELLPAPGEVKEE